MYALSNVYDREILNPDLFEKSNLRKNKKRTFPIDRLVDLFAFHKYLHDCLDALSDSKAMEKFNVKCKVERNERSYVIAVENIDAGEEILLENPILITPNWDSEIRCSTCFRESNIVCKYMISEIVIQNS